MCIVHRVAVSRVALGSVGQSHDGFRRPLAARYKGWAVKAA